MKKTKNDIFRLSEKPEELGEAFDEALELDKPFIVDIKYRSSEIYTNREISKKLI